MHVWFLVSTGIEYVGKKKKRVQLTKPKYDVISAHTVRLRRRGRKYRNKM